MTILGVMWRGGRPGRGAHSHLGRPQPLLLKVLTNKNHSKAVGTQLPTPLPPAPSSLVLVQALALLLLCQMSWLSLALSSPRNMSRLITGSAVENHFEDENS